MPRPWPTSTIATAGRSTSPTRCAAASTSTTGAWPSSTPRKRPIACASSKRGARSSIARTDGRILQRNFGGHRYPRLAHVGDRTGLEMIRTLQDHGVHRGIDVHMEFTVVRLLIDGGRVVGVVRLRARARTLQGVQRQGGRARHRRRRPRLQDHEQQLGRHRRRPCAGLPCGRRAARHGVHPVPSDRHGLAAERAGHPGHRRRARRRRRPSQQEGRRFMFDDIPDNYKNADGRRRRGRLALYAGRQDGQASARAADPRPRGALHHARGEGRPRQPARRRLPRHRLDQEEAAGRRGAHQAEAAEHVPPVQGTGRHRHHEGADGSRSDDALHHGRHSRGRRHADVDDSRVCSRRANARPASTAPTGSAATRSRT